MSDVSTVGISASWTLGKKVITYGFPILTLVLGILLGSKGCFTPKPQIIVRCDTLTVDTSKIIEHTPIIVKNVTLFIRDTASCESALPPFALSEGDTISIARINSCKGILEGITLIKKPDTVRFTSILIHTDTVIKELPFEISTSKFFNYELSARAGSGIGCLLNIALDGNFTFGKFGAYVSPQLLYIDKLHPVLTAGIFYKIF